MVGFQDLKKRKKEKQSFLTPSQEFSIHHKYLSSTYQKIIIIIILRNEKSCSVCAFISLLLNSLASLPLRTLLLTQVNDLMLIEFHMPNWTLLHTWSVWQLPNFIMFIGWLVCMPTEDCLNHDWVSLKSLKWLAISCRPIYLSFPFIIWKHKTQNECINHL